MKIEKVVNEKFDEILKSGFIESKIKETLEKTVSYLIDESMQSYSDFGKTLKEKIKSAIKIDNLKLDLPDYNQLVSNWITEMVNNVIISDSKKQIEANIKKFFIPLKKSEYKITEIIEEFKKSFMDEYNSHEGNITFIAADESSTCKGFFDFYFDEKPDRDQYQCDYSFGIHIDELWRMSLKGTDVNKMKYPNLYNFDSFMFQLYTSKVKIINDSDEVETYFSNYDY